MSFTALADPPRKCTRCTTLEQCIATNRGNYETHLAQVKLTCVEKEAECEKLRQTVTKLQAQLKSSETRVEQLVSANGVIGKMYNDNAEYIRRAQTAEKEASDAKKRAAGWKRLARKRKNAMQKTKKENVALSTELKKLQRDATEPCRGVRHSVANILTGTTMDAVPEERSVMKIITIRKGEVKTPVQRSVHEPRYTTKVNMTLDELRHHMENASSFWDKDKAKMKCPVCKKQRAAQGATHVLDHMMTHVASSHRPYKCPVPECDFTCIQASAVPRHALSKHELSWDCDDVMSKQMRHEENLRRFEEFRELANKSAMKPPDAH